MIIKLPSTAVGLPDWDFMEQYIKSLNHKPLTTDNQGGYKSHTLDVVSWKEFCVGDLFEVKREKDSLPTNKPMEKLHTLGQLIQTTA